MYWKCTETKVQCGHKRVMKFLFLWLNSWLRARLNGIWLQEKIHLLSTCCSFEKEKHWIFTIFPDFIFIFQSFFRSEKLLCKLKTFSRIQDCMNPVYRTVKKHYTRAYCSLVYFEAHPHRFFPGTWQRNMHFLSKMKKNHTSIFWRLTKTKKCQFMGNEEYW